MGKEHFGWSAMSLRVHIVTEGQTETNFVKKILAPYFLCLDIMLIPCTVVTKNDRKAGRQYKGGISHYLKAKNDILKCLTYARSDKNVFVSTIFDVYHLPVDFPGYYEASEINDPYSRVEFLEKSLQDDIDKGGFSFFPYLSLHEFEALLFSSIDVLAEHFFDKNVKPLMDIVLQYPNPELINKGEQTSPSKRILQYVPEYAKVTDGVAIAGKIGLDLLRAKCAHFDTWIKKLEDLNSKERRSI
jgi:hypothetical protein